MMKDLLEVQPPTEGEWFEVNPMTIDQILFLEKRDDLQQEKTRQLILEAFAEMKNNSKYARPFKTLIPEKTWEVKTVSELSEMACHLGNHMADWVEQALEWAQRIANGETWKSICSRGDTTKCRRLVFWEDDCFKLVGGVDSMGYRISATEVSKCIYCYAALLANTVPLVVSYD